MSQTSVHSFISLTCIYNMVRVIEGKIINYRNDLKGSKNGFFKLVGGSSYRGFELLKVKLQ